MFNSLNRRYIVVSVLWIIYLLISALVIHNNVVHLRQQNAQIYQERQSLLQLNQALTFEIGKLEHLLQTYLLQPSKGENELVTQTLSNLDDQLSQFKKTPLIENYELSKNIHKLEKGLAELKKSILQLISVRESVHSLFPASSIMFDEMLPSNHEFYSAASIAIQESSERNRAQRKAKALLTKIRHNWIFAIGAFRVYIANRVGVFSIDTEESLYAQKSNVMLYLGVVKKDLKELAKFKLNFEQTDAVNTMQQAIDNWFDAFERATKIYESENWRADLPILVHKIDPAKRQVWEALKDNDRYLELMSNKEKEELSVATNRITYSYIILVIFGILLTVAGYMGFDYLVRRPVGQISKGLLREAQGKLVEPIKATNIEEIDKLIDAFNEITTTANLSNKKLNLMMGHVNDGIFIVDKEGFVESVNPGFEELFGFKAKELIGRNISVVVSESHRQAHRTYVEKMYHAAHILGKNRQLLAQGKEGLEFYVNLKLFEFESKSRTYFMGLVNKLNASDGINIDYDESDVLTGLYNSKYIKNRLKIKIGSEKASGVTGGMLYCDIDDMLMIELEHGQKQVEDILVQLAEFLRNRIRREDTVARSGYDEFVVLLDAEKETCIKVAEDIRKRIEEKNWVKSMKMTVSIGVLMLSDASTDDVEDVLNCAKEACKLAKKAGSNRIHVFNRAILDNLADPA